VITVHSDSLIIGVEMAFKRGRAPGVISKDRYERLRALNPLFAQGGYTLAELSARFGVSMPVISEDRDYIMANWWRSEAYEETKDARLLRVKELEQIKRFALESYYRSRQDKEEVTTRYDKKECEECHGTGKLPKCRCLNCEGIGYVTEEIISRKVSGNPGDAAFLNTARGCLVDICRLEALFKEPEVKVQHVISGGITHSHSLENKYRDVDPNLVMDAKRAMALLEEAVMRNVIEGELVEKKEDVPD